MRAVLLAHDYFPDRAKTAIGVMRYGDVDPVAVVDRSTPAPDTGALVPDVPTLPIHSSVADLEPAAADCLIIGVAPIGGQLDESWRGDIRAALERGWTVLSGLHTRLAADQELAVVAEANDATIRDVRHPPDTLEVSAGQAGAVDATVVLTVGTDCSVGKMTTTMEVAAALRAAGHSVAVVPTGQTGIMIEGWGIAVDAVPSDFVAGAVEEMVLEVADDVDYVVVEGQGSLTHPAYSAVTLGILHGAMPDRLILCHEACRSTVHGYDDFELPPLETAVSLYERVAAPVAETAVAAGSLNTADLSADRARAAIESYATTIDAPATDVIRFDADRLLEGIT